jgi:5'-nucleotidase
VDKLILISNDDGIDSVGIKVLEKALLPLGRVVVVAPDSEQSGSSHSLTLRKPIETTAIDDDHYRISGTPTDCVLLATQVILDRCPDILVSGINHGPNMGEDVTYSGTVAAAFEGTILGIQSVAVSSLQRNVDDAEINGRYARLVVEKVLEAGLPGSTLLNVNIPDPTVSPVKGVKITNLGSRHYENFIDKEPSQGGKTLYTIGGADPVWTGDERTDIAAVRGGYVSITPLNLDMTDYKAIVEMERWRFEP